MLKPADRQSSIPIGRLAFPSRFFHSIVCGQLRTSHERDILSRVPHAVVTSAIRPQIDDNGKPGYLNTR